MLSRKSIVALSIVAISALAIPLLIFSLSSAPTNSVGNFDAPNTYDSTAYNFSMQYPNGWILDESVDEFSPTSSTLVSFSDPDNEAIIGIGKISDVAYRSYGILETAEDFAEVTKAQLQQTYGRNIVLTDEGHLVINGVDAYFITYARLDDSTIDKMVLLRNGDAIYLVVFNVDTDSYDKYALQFEESLSTFRFLSKQVDYTNAQ